MRVTFDLSFDAGAWPGPLAGRDAVAGESWLGPVGFLGLIETLLGLTALRPSAAERGAALIPRMLQSQSFWTKSAAVDPLSTAQLLISWHDALRLEGWKGQPASKRLASLAEVMGGLAPSVAERLDTASKCLPSGAGVLEALVLLEQRQDFPRAWRELFDALEASGTVVEVRPLSPAPAAATSDLARARAPRFVPTADRSLQLIRTGGPLESADAVATALAAEPDVPTVFIGTEPVLDAALKRHGLPTTGATGGPADNALLQLLPLVVTLGWKPADPDRVYELLTLRESPIRGEVRWRLLHALQKYPAVDSDRWRDALAIGIEEIDDAAHAERLGILLTPRVPHGTAYPMAELEQRVGALLAWLQVRAAVATTDDEAARFGAALGQCACFLSLVTAAGVSRLSDSGLRRFIDEATAAASGPVLLPAQAGFSSVRAPGALAGPAPRVVWWRFDAETAPVPHPLPLTAGERQSLLALGVVVPDAAVLARREVERWRRPLLQASRALWLVCPTRMANGDAAEPHPVWDEVVGRFEDGTPEHALEVAQPRLQSKLPQAPREALPLIRARMDWKTSLKLPRREKESPSSIAGFLGCSLQWTLQRVGGIYAGQSAGPTGGPQMLGTLAHHILELVMTGPARSPAEGKAEAERLFNTEGPRFAAPLFLPGWTHDRDEACSAIARTAGALCSLRELGWEPEAVEEEVAGKAFATVFAGTPDLVVKRGTERAVLDFKWGSRERHLAELRGGTALQLSAYAELVRQQKGSPPHVAYLIVREARLLTSATELDAHLAVNAPAIADTWSAVEKTHALAWKALAKGALAAPGTAAEVPKNDTLKDGVLALTPPCHFCSYGGLCGRQFGAEVSNVQQD